jgi:hypothetical protein
MKKILIGTTLLMSATAVLAQGQPPDACKQVAQACQQAGFKKGDWKKGDGLWRDCVDPIMQGQTSVAGATKPLPSVNPQVVADCKAKHPKFGAGKVGSQK